MLLVDVLLVAGFLINDIAYSKIGLPVTVYASVAIVATPVLFVAMGLVLLVLMRCNYADGFDRWWMALVAGMSAGTMIWCLIDGISEPQGGALIGGAAGMSLWLCFRKPFRSMRSGY